MRVECIVSIHQTQGKIRSSFHLSKKCQHFLVLNTEILLDELFLMPVFQVKMVFQMLFLSLNTSKSDLYYIYTTKLSFRILGPFLLYLELCRQKGIRQLIALKHYVVMKKIVD